VLIRHAEFRPKRFGAESNITCRVPDCCSLRVGRNTLEQLTSAPGMRCRRYVNQDPMLLEGSCHCAEAVRFSVQSSTPVSHSMRCYCRNLQGNGWEERVSCHQSWSAHENMKASHGYLNMLMLPCSMSQAAAVDDQPCLVIESHAAFAQSSVHSTMLLDCEHQRADNYIVHFIPPRHCSGVCSECGSGFVDPACLCCRTNRSLIDNACAA